MGEAVEWTISLSIYIGSARLTSLADIFDLICIFILCRPTHRDSRETIDSRVMHDTSHF